MKLIIFYFNKITKEYKEIFEYYFKKLIKNININIIELEEYSKADFVSNQLKNEELINKKIKDFKDFELFLLDINSKQYTSIEFAKIIENNKNFKSAKIGFIIGPSDGFSNEFKKNFNKKISFGNLTLPHQLVRIILLEQIYRAFKIINNEPYHK
ncbi:23S rRNA (pseudouridine1915-N3)-methyltransferase [Spiroplasma gladiatoris]|uniref:Ribosomal RNA large subunit methyltransferase H n=1 Tax=Spiroplasma gladiatoris TaxID=2143 RepID=A0A4P7AIQ6_9MOLU|nr:23S rRNA (pseudouridine(1915)-N(3))-methyltransferase RlmH [Spiroplasma gladiatoris]QBQ07526.1 23S rRNA (pseudouridine1915-N3)-methyltransferase [Spiroplasma gladiatoris]